MEKKWPQVVNLDSFEFYDTQAIKPLFNTFPFMTSLKSLKINTKKNDPPAIEKSDLTNLANLSELNTWDDNYELGYFPADRFGVNYEIFDNLKELKVAKLQKRNYLDCAKIQSNHPDVRFQWCQKLPNDSKRFEVDHYYEGEFSGESTYGGEGVVIFPNGDRYEGGLKNNVYHGHGIYYFSDGTKYDVSFKNGKKVGKGMFFDTNGNRLEEKEAVLLRKYSFLAPKISAPQPVEDGTFPTAAPRAFFHAAPNKHRVVAMK